MNRPHISEQQLSFCKRLKKIELHAHLNGSVRASTLRHDPGCTCMGVKLCLPGAYLQKLDTDMLGAYTVSWHSSRAQMRQLCGSSPKVQPLSVHGS